MQSPVAELKKGKRKECDSSKSEAKPKKTKTEAYVVTVTQANHPDDRNEKVCAVD